MKTYSIRYSVYPYNVEIHVLGIFFFPLILFLRQFPFFSLSFISFQNSCQFPVGFAGLITPFSSVYLSFICLTFLVSMSQSLFLGCLGIFTFSFCFLHCLCCCLCPFSVLSILVLCGQGFPQMPVGHEFLAHG